MTTKTRILQIALSASIFVSITFAQGGPPAYFPPIFFADPAPAIPPPPPGSPARIFVTSDVNNDGFPDLIHLNTALAPDAVVVHTGLPGGAFVLGPPLFLPAGFPATEIAVGDMNGDGFQDLIILSAPLSAVMVCPGVGGGLFIIGPVVLIVAPGVPLGMHITEVTGDGLADILVLMDAPGGAPAVDTVQTLINLGGFAFGLGPISPIGAGTTQFKTADLNLDGAQDIVTLRTVPTTAFYIHVGIGGGGFVPGPIPLIAIPAGVATTTFHIADLNGDNILDLATYRPGVGVMFTFMGTGVPGFAPTFASPAPVGGLSNFTIGDLNGDGVLDATYLFPAAPTVLDQLGTGFGTMAPAIFPTAQPGLTFWQAVADFDIDGKLDIATLSSAAAAGDGVWININGQPVPPGLANYGMATPGCRGAHGMLTNGAPIVGTPAFGFTSTNAPSYALGLLLITDVASFGPVDPFGIGTFFLLDFFTSTTIYAFDMFSRGPTGSAFMMTGIPADPLLVGMTFYAESAWVFTPNDACYPSPTNLTTSEGLSLTILP